MKKYTLVFIALLSLFAASASAEKMRIAIMDLEPRGVSGETASVVSEALRSELFKTGHFIIVERNEMASILAEQGLQATGCTETECAVEMGKLLNARKMLVGTVGALGTTRVISARIVDVENGTLDFAESIEAASEDEILAAVRELAGIISSKISSGGLGAPEPVVPGRYRRLAGIVCWGLGGAGLAVGGWQNAVLAGVKDDLVVLEGEYDAMETGTAQDFEDAWQAIADKNAEQDGPVIGTILGYAVGGALVATGTVLYFWPGKSRLSLRAGARGAEVSYAF